MYLNIRSKSKYSLVKGPMFTVKPVGILYLGVTVTKSRILLIYIICVCEII